MAEATESPKDKLDRIAAWYVTLRNDEGAGIVSLEGFYVLLGMTQHELYNAYLAKGNEVKKVLGWHDPR